MYEVPVNMGTTQQHDSKKDDNNGYKKTIKMVSVYP